MPAPSPATSDFFTELVLDARGLVIRPAMIPKMLNQSGKEIYESAMVDRDFAVQQGMVGYARELSAAQKNDRVAANPLTLKALSASGQGRADIMISDSDAAKLLSVAESMIFLRKCRVMIVLD